MAAKQPAEPMACLSIDYNKYLMPMGKAVVIFEALSSAEKVSKDYDTATHMHYFKVAAPSEVTLEMVSLAQLARMRLEE
jgi:hypothetical protein